MKSKIIVRNKNHLMKLIYDEIQLNGNNCDLNHLNTSNVTNMSRVFNFNNQFNGNISEWNVSNVEDMYSMFENSAFNGDISQWDVSNVEYMSSMFSGSGFKGNLSNWRPYKLRKVDNVFLECPINPPYWTNYRNKKLRNKAINTYVFNNELKNELSVNENNTKILKI